MVRVDSESGGHSTEAGDADDGATGSIDEAKAPRGFYLVGVVALPWRTWPIAHPSMRDHSIPDSTVITGLITRTLDFKSGG